MVMKSSWILKAKCMVMKMNKSEFINILSKELDYSKDQCTIINDILENHFFLSKKNKNKIINELTKSLNVSESEATNIYNTSLKIIKEEMKNKLKHPFKSKN